MTGRRAGTQTPPAQQLRKILEYERLRRCRDEAVVGGLDRLLATFLGRDGLPEDSAIARAIRALGSRGYRGLSPDERRRWIDGALHAIAAGKAPAPTRAEPWQRVARAPAVKTVDAPITALKGVKESLASQFEALGVGTVRDLLYLFPRRHNDFARLRPIGELTPGEEETVRGRVWSAEEKQLGRTTRGTEATIGDESGMMRVVWFNQPWIAKQLRTNTDVVLSGRVTLYKGRPTLESPEWELWEEGEELTHTGRLVPVYPQSGRLRGRTIRRIIRQALDEYASLLTDPLPDELRERLGLVDIDTAVRQAHYPDTHEAVDAARRRLAFDELLPLQLSVLVRRRQWQQPGTAPSLRLPPAVREGFVAGLPFELTGAQRRALDALLADLARDVPMSRLLQGDVGSGKTVVAACGLLAAVTNGKQAVIMAPTEVLAEQHFRTLRALFGAEGHGVVLEAALPYLDRPLRIAFLSGSVRAAGRREVYERVASGEIDIVAGTHALIQEGVTFRELGFVIVDEQHRFGVMQRAALRDKSRGNGDAPSAHLLVMSATPIPRSLYLTLYGDLDVSVIDEMPPGRQPVETHWWPPDRRQEAYDFLRTRIDAGRQAFVICPLVEESETLQSKSAVQEYERLRAEVYPDLEIELVHGRMKGAEKDAAMRRFREGEAHVLVSTAVVEVGIDVPNATVMLIEGADRFGLAQLHQFRGRVGRGGDQAYCLLLAESPSEEARQRLRLMEETTDGFKLAEADLHMRGPGEFFGTRQSGLPDFRVASLLDTRMIELARGEAARLLEADPELSRPEHALLAAEAARLLEQVTGEVH